MPYNTREQLKKEYEMLIEESMEEIEREQAIIAEDYEYAKELAVLFKDILIKFAKDNSEEVEKAVNRYLERINLIEKYRKNDNNLNKIKNKIIKKLNQEIKKINEQIDICIYFKSRYTSKLKNVSRLEEEWLGIKKELNDLTSDELKIFKDFTSEISKEINSEVKKRTRIHIILSKIADVAIKVLQSMFFGVMVWGAIKLRCKIFKEMEMGNRIKFIFSKLKKHPVIILDIVGVRVLERSIEKSLVEQIRRSKKEKSAEKEVYAHKKVDIHKEHNIQCIHNSKELNNNISLDVR